MFYSQKGQDEWVVGVLGGEPGYFVEVGAGNGKDDSNTLALEEKGWDGLCIEPNPRSWYYLSANRTCALDAVVIDREPGRVLFRTDNGYLSGIVASDTDNNPDVRLGEMVCESLRADTLTNVLDHHQAPSEIDYLSLDVEGAEERVLRGLDLKKYQFKCITVERPTPWVNNRLHGYGYVFVKNFKMDSFYVHHSVLDKVHKVEPFEQLPRKDW